MHGGGATHSSSDEENGVTMIKSWMGVTFKDENCIKTEEIARQAWEYGQIIEEIFYYNPGMMTP